MGLAVKHRPKFFSEIYGQDNVVQVLKNQLAGVKRRQDDPSYGGGVGIEIRHAYLFTGGAGTGKTTAARIFAQQLGAETIEVDAASNNGVDDVRKIREECRYRSLTAAYKVYIIDEVHMLSTGAFNALLKTLEEPPAHVIFILCTTDPHKIPSTILSRCQRFDFKRVPLDLVVNRLKVIICVENDEADPTGAGDMYSVTPEALEYIAKLTDGGMRDAISLLETCLDHTTELDVEQVEQILGQSSYSDCLSIATMVVTKDLKGVIEAIEDIHNDGKDLKQFVRRFMEFTIELAKAHMFKNLGFTKIPSLYEKQVFELLDLVLENGILLRQWFVVLNELSSMIRYESHPKVLIQGVFLQL